MSMSPRTIRYDDSLDVLWEEVTYTEARLRADPSTADLAARFTDFHPRLDTVRTGLYGAWRAEIVAQARVDQADAALDACVLAVDAALDRAGEPPDAPRRRRYFRGDAARKITVQGLANELQVVRAWPASLATEDDDELRAQAEPLRLAVVRSEEALAERVRAQNTRRDFIARDRARLVDELNALRAEVYVELARRAVGHRHPRGWPGAFFRKGRGSQKGKAPDTPTRPMGASPRPSATPQMG